MRIAIKEAKRSIEDGNRGYGAVVVRGQAIVASAHDTVFTDFDVTAHAEVNAIRKATKVLKTIDLSGCVLFATNDPCTMCGSVSLWANITRIIIGLSREQADETAIGIQFPIEKLAFGSSLKLYVTRGILSEEIRELQAARAPD